MLVLRADPEVPQEVPYVIGCEPRPRNGTTSTETSGSSIVAWFSIMYIKREWGKNRRNPKYMFNENAEEMVDLAVCMEQGLFDVPKPKGNIWKKEKYGKAVTFRADLEEIVEKD